MFDQLLALQILQQIEWSIQTIQKRFKPILRADDFMSSDEGLEKLDAICMQLIALGESLKNLDKVTAQTLLPRYPEIRWQRIKGMRDVLSHHYFDINAEIVYEVCANHMDRLHTVIQQMMNELQ